MMNKKILVIITNKMSARIFFETNLAKNILQSNNVEGKCITIDYNVPDSFRSLIGSKILHHNKINKSKTSYIVNYFKKKIKKFLFRSLVYRFNSICSFSSHNIKRNFSLARKIKELNSGNVCISIFGWPLCKNLLIFNKMYNFYYESNLLREKYIQRKIKSINPDIILIFHIQNVIARDYIAEALKLNVPVIGYVSSWDQPTTKGPIFKSLNSYIVQNSLMAKELVHFHEVPKDKIHVNGWPQMDIYFDRTIFLDKVSFLKKYNLSDTTKIVLFAAYSKRLGAHEKDILDYLFFRFINNEYGENCTLVIRPHPKDTQWYERFIKYNRPPYIIVQPAEYGNLEKLANFLLYSNVVICTNGSITLDAIAFDKNVINIGFDGDQKVKMDESVKLLYNMDHYKRVLNSRGIKLAVTYLELNNFIKEFLSDDNCLLEGKKSIRQEYLEPLDGFAVKRIIQTVVDC